MKKIILLSLVKMLFLMPATFASAQSTIRGSVVNGDGQPLEVASVLLVNSTDSSLVQGQVTTKSGSYAFTGIPPGSYFIASSYAGLKDTFSEVFQLYKGVDISLPTLKIQKQEINVGNVTVTSKRPLYEQKIDRMIINVANSITNAGSTALDVLMRSPGILVNQQNMTISMSGKEGVFVMLNGKINRMPVTALVQMLSGMSSSNIERIELITTPPANFDAEGNAGFINIILKKNMEYGTNGSFSLTAGYGVGGGPVEGGSINLNHRRPGWNVYGDYSFGRTTPNTLIHATRKIIGNHIIENFMTTDRDDFRRNHSGRLGVDYELSNKTVLGVLLSGFNNMYGMKALNTTNIYKNGSLDTTIIIDNPERHPLNNYSVNVNLLQHFKAEEQLSVNLDYIYYNDANTLTYLNNFYSGNGSFIYSDRTKSNKETPINFWVATANYSKNLGKKTNIEAGVKSTFSTFINDVMVERELQNNWKIDNDLTAKHNLKESILAAYTSFNITFNEKTKSKIGVRYEYTNSNLGSETKKNIVDRQYGNLFPSVFLSHDLNDKSSLNFSYNRRITRPTFNEMAPFIYFIDPNTFFSGNPALQPSISDAIKVDYILKPFIFSLSYTYEKNTITNFTPTVDPVKNKQTFAGQNQQYKHMANATVSLPITATKWWTMQNSITGQWNQLHALYKGVPLIITQPTLQLNSTQSFVLPKDYSIEVNGNYQSGGFFGFFRMKSTLSLNFGLQKKLPNNMGTFILNVTDFSGPPYYRIYVDAPEQNLISYFNGRFTVTTFKLTYSRNFGSSKVKANRTRQTGSEEEKQRVQAN